MADSTLEAIQKKVRRITRSPSQQQLSTADLKEYINTFILYEFPQELRLNSLRTNLTFYTEPNVDTYETSTTAGDPLCNFKNVYTAVHNPVFVAGQQVYLSQSEEEFYNRYPFTNTEEIIDVGDGATFIFSGTLTATPVLQNKVIFGTVDTAGIARKAYDDGDGTLTGDGTGSIDYVTGVWDFTWNDAVKSGENIYSFTYSYQVGRPQTILYFDNKFVVRPVPDKTYPIQIAVDVRPTELTAGLSPELEQWWLYIAYGASLNIFYDRTEIESVQEIMPEFKRHEMLALRRTLVNDSKNRTFNIYRRRRNSVYY